MKFICMSLIQVHLHFYLDLACDLQAAGLAIGGGPWRRSGVYGVELLSVILGSREMAGHRISR